MPKSVEIGPLHRGEISCSMFFKYFFQTSCQALENRISPPTVPGGIDFLGISKLQQQKVSPPKNPQKREIFRPFLDLQNFRPKHYN